MNRIIRILSILLFVSLGIATDNTGGKSEAVTLDKAATIDVASEESTEIVTNNQTLAPIEIEKMKKVREGISQTKKKHAAQILHKHKNPETSEFVNPNLEIQSKHKKIQAHIKKSNKDAGIFKRFGETMRKKYKTITLRSEDGKRALKFPTDTETN